MYILIIIATGFGGDAVAINSTEFDSYTACIEAKTTVQELKPSKFTTIRSECFRK